MSHHDRLPMTGAGTTTPGVTVERVVERVAAKFQCNQRFRRSSPWCLCS